MRYHCVIEQWHLPKVPMPGTGRYRSGHASIATSGLAFRPLGCLVSAHLSRDSSLPTEPGIGTILTARSLSFRSKTFLYYLGSTCNDAPLQLGRHCRRVTGPGRTCNRLHGRILAMRINLPDPGSLAQDLVVAFCRQPTLGLPLQYGSPQQSVLFLYSCLPTIFQAVIALHPCGTDN